MSFRLTQHLERAWPSATICLSPLVGLLLVVLLCKTLTLSSLTPGRCGSSVEEVVVCHQRAAALEASTANLLFVGDSTCLMNLDLAAIPAADRRSQRPLNLGMLSILPLSECADLVAEFARKNPGRPASVILLISPSMLDQEPARPFSGIDPPQTGLLEFTSLRVFRDLIQRGVPVTLPGKYGRFYGFDLALDQFMRRHGGSAVDPGELGRTTPNPYPIEIGESFRDQCALFRARFPRHCKLLVGLAPVPREQHGSDFSSRHQELSSELKSLVGADNSLRLPASYPAILFASPTHLRAQARTLYTRHLWNAVVVALNE